MTGIRLKQKDYLILADIFNLTRREAQKNCPSPCVLLISKKTGPDRIVKSCPGPFPILLVWFYLVSFAGSAVFSLA